MTYTRGSIEGRFKASDPEAVGTVSRWIAMVVASSRFQSVRSDWVDLHQEVMARVLESLRRENFDASRDFRAYVQGIARNTALQALIGQRRGTRPLDETPLVDARTESGEDDLARRLLARRVLDCASEGCRELMKMYFFERRSYDEIATALGVPIGTIKSRMFRCLESARREVRGHRRNPEEVAP